MSAFRTTARLGRALTLGLLALCFSHGIARADAEAPLDREAYMREVHDNLIRFGEVYRSLAFRYVDQIDPEAAMTAAIHGLMDELDPYTDYYLEDEAQELDDMSRGQYGGIGTEVGLRGSDKRITIISPFEGSPSWKAGLLPGDEIVTVNGTAMAGKALNDAVKLIKGPVGSEVILGIRRSGAKEVKDYRITRQLINIQDVKLAQLVDPATGTGYVRLVRFTGLAGENLAAAIDSLKRQGLKRLVLDLRGNPGGLLREAAAVSELFLAKGQPIVDTRGRNDEMIKAIVSEREPVFTGDLVVLIDPGSASASEIVAGCLQDLDRAVLVGESSFGKGLVQSVVDLDKEAKVKLTTARYYLPSGRLIQRVDYFQDNEVLNHVADSTLADTLFHTAKGREVISGRGVTPDVEVKAPRQPWLVLELWRGAHFANYVADRAAAGKLLDGPAGDAMLKDFRAYLEEKEFKYQPRGGNQADELKKILEEEKVGDEGAKALEALLKSLGGELDPQFLSHREDIARMLDLELVNHRQGPEARAREALRQDPAYQKALELLVKGHGELERVLGSVDK
jgi:carboxyl-terminal processing protease